MIDAEKILLTGDILEPELDIEEGLNIDQVFLAYEYASIVDSIGTQDFRETYLNMINDVKESSFRKQIELAKYILSKIEEVYEFTFLSSEITTVDMLFDIYKFLEFVEYDHIPFLVSIWEKFNVDLRKLDIEKFLNSNQDKLMNIIDSSLSSYKNELISQFIRTYSKDKMVEYVIKISLGSRMIIVLEIVTHKEDEKKGEGDAD